MRIILALVLSLFMSLSYAATEKEWTVLVYLNADNSLYQASFKDIKEMLALSSNDNVNLLVFYDKGSNESTKILSISKGESKVVMDFKRNIDTGDYMNLSYFFKIAKDKFPAKRYLIDVWNHGNGWIDKGVSNLEDSDKGISYDDTTGHFISTTQLGEAMAEIKNLNGGKNIEILAMDACLMNMAEIVHEVHESVNYVLGSQEVEPGDGWDYRRQLSPLMENPMMATEDFLRNSVSVFVSQYNADATQSAINVAKFEEVIPAVKDFVNYALKLLPQNRILFAQARSETRAYDEKSYKDFIHFLNRLAAKTNDTELTRLSNMVSARLQQAVVANSYSSNRKNSNGISVWLPDTEDSIHARAYSDLKWTQDTTWLKFLEETTSK